MTPSLCDRQLIYIVAVIVLVCLGIAGALAYTGHDGTTAAFIGVATAALGILSPSPLKQHSTGASVDAGPSGTVNVTNPPAEPAVVEEPAP